MDRPSEKVLAAALIGALALAMGTVLPHSGARAAMGTEPIDMFTPNLACGPAETLVGTGAAGLLARVRVDATSTAPRLREAKGRTAGRRGARKAPRVANKAPKIEAEPRAVVLRSFYTCNSASDPNVAAGSGWRLVGPLRQS